MTTAGIIKTNLDNFITFLNPFCSLANTHMVDYFTTNAFHRLIPQEILNEITNNESQIINQVFSNNCNNNLQKFLNDCSKNSLKNCKFCLTPTEFLNILNCNENGRKLNVFMNSKKSHEVEIMSSISVNLHRTLKTSHLIDIGDGKGYLSSMLALNHEIPVLGIDASQTNTDGAIKRVQKLSKIVFNKKIPEKNYKQITKFVEEQINFEEVIENIFLEKPNRLGLIGLHTCGDLSPTSIKIFVNNSAIRSICNVGCCYHLLSSTGFPLSQYLRSRNFKIDKPARMIAAQSVDRILNKKELPSKTIFYRAVFEQLLNDFDVDVPSRQVGRFRKPSENFIDYTRTALKRLKIDKSVVVSDEDILKVFKKFDGRQDELNLFYLIRCMLAPVIEGVILLDRLLYLMENGCEDTFLVKLFDPVVSPRCYGIVSIKK